MHILIQGALKLTPKLPSKPSGTKVNIVRSNPKTAIGASNIKKVDTLVGISFGIVVYYFGRIE